jgi:hypothetical protein
MPDSFSWDRKLTAGDIPLLMDLFRPAIDATAAGPDDIPQEPPADVFGTDLHNPENWSKVRAYAKSKGTWGANKRIWRKAKEMSRLARIKKSEAYLLDPSGAPWSTTATSAS